MSEIDRLIEDIDKLRTNLNNLIKKKDGDLQDPEVLSASQMLNSVLTEYNKLLIKKLGEN